MKLFHVIQAALVATALVSIPASAQDLFALPAATDSSANNQAVNFSPTTLKVQGQFVVGPGAYRIISNIDSSKYYVLSSDAQAPLTTVTQNGSVVKTIPGIYSGVSGAVLTPDGATLYAISAGGLFAFNTSNDQPITLPQQTTNYIAVDVDASLDSTKLFAILSSSFNSKLRVISNSTHLLLTELLLPATPTSVTVGPNGLVYVSALNVIVEVDPNSFLILHEYTIAGTPGKLAFSPDGRYAIANNTVTGPSVTAVTLIDLQAHAVVGSVDNSALASGSYLNSIWPISAGQALGYAASAGQLYTITYSPLSIAPSTLLPQNKPPVDVTVSGDLAFGSHTTTASLFYATSSTLVQIAIASGAATESVFTPDYVQSLSSTSPALTGTPAGLLLYGNNQQLVLGAASQPIVVRAVDAQGNPLSGVAVQFVPPAGVAIQNTQVTTNMLGYASTTFTAPLVSGTLAIQANVAGGLTAAFSHNVGSAGPGGVPAALSVVAGQGQLGYEVTLASAGGSPLSVLVTDINGVPVPGAEVDFNLAQGNGSLVLFQSNGQVVTFNHLQVNTDSTGVASIDMVTPAIQNLYPGFDQEVINASLANGLSTPIYFTTISHREGVTVTLKAPLVGTNYSGPAGSIIKSAFKYQIVSSAGPGIPNVSMVIIPSGDPAKTPSGACAGTPLSDGDGVLTCDLVLNGVLGSSQIVPQVGYFVHSLPFNITITAGPPSKFAIVQGNTQSGKGGTVLPLALIARLEDSYGNLLPKIPVTWSVVSGSAAITQSTTITNSYADTLAYLTLGATPGNVIVAVTAGTGANAATGIFTATVLVTPGNIASVSGDTQSANLNQPFGAPLVARALDNEVVPVPVPGATISFAVVSGDVTLSAPSAITDVNGNGGVNVTAGSAVGPVVVSATYAGFTTLFHLNVTNNPANIQFQNGASFQVTGANPGAIAPGEIVTIIGDSLTTGVQGVLTPGSGLATELGGVQVLFGGIPAPLFAVVNSNGNQQINALVPFELGAATSTSVTISNSAGSTTLTNIPVQPLSPGFFQFVLNGQSLMVAVRASDGQYLSPLNPAKPGDTVIAFVNGLGQATPALTSSAPGSSELVTAPITITVNGEPAANVTAQYQSQAYGLYLVWFTLPSDLNGGVYPVTLSAVGSDTNVYSAQSTFIAVSGN